VEASIALKNVSKHFKKKYVLSNLTFGIEKGSTFAIIGRNGAGKSTFLRILSTLLKADEGILYINGNDMSKSLKDVNKVIGYLPDHDIHDPWLTGLENLKIRANYLGISESEFDSITKPLIEEFEMEDSINNYPVTYSRGIKRRLDIIQTLMGDSEIIILDEPLLGLDYYIRTVLCKYLLRQKGKKTVVIASNEFTEIQTMADRWIVLHDGGIRFDGTLEKMLTHVKMPFIGNLEIKKDGEELDNILANAKNIKEVRDFGNFVQIVTNDFEDFYKITRKIKEENITSISGNSSNIEEFLNLLLSDEGF